MFIGKTAQVLSETNTNISPATGIDSVYYEKAEWDKNGKNVSVFKQNVAKHMAIQFYYDQNNIESFDTSTQQQNTNDTLLFGYTDSSILFKGNETTYQIIKDGSIYIDGKEYGKNQVLNRNQFIKKDQTDHIIGFNVSTSKIKANLNFTNDDTSFLSVDLAKNKHDITNILDNYTTIDTIDQYSVWIENKSDELAYDACTYFDGKDKQINASIIDISNKLVVINSSIEDVSKKIKDGSLDKFTESRLSMDNSNLSLEDFNDKLYNKQLDFGKLYKFVYNASTLHGNVFSGNVYDDHLFYITAIADSSASISTKVIASKYNDETYFDDQNINGWTILYDNTYLANLRISGDNNIWYRIEDKKDILNYYTNSSLNKISDLVFFCPSIDTSIYASKNKGANNIITNKNIEFFVSKKSSTIPELLLYVNGPDTTFSYTENGKTYTYKVNKHNFYKVNIGSNQYIYYNDNDLQYENPLYGLSILPSHTSILTNVSVNEDTKMYGNIIYMKDEYGNEAPYDFKNRRMMGKNYYTFPGYEQTIAGHKLYRLTLTAPDSSIDFYNSSILKTFIDTYINKSKNNIIDSSQYIEKYCYSLNKTDDQEVGGDYIDFIFEYSKNPTNIQDLYDALDSSDLIGFSPKLDDLNKIDTYNYVRFKYKSPTSTSPTAGKEEVYNMIQDYLGMKYETFVNELSTHLDANQDKEHTYNNTYTFKVPYGKNITKAGIGYGNDDYSGDRESCQLSNGWYISLKKLSEHINSTYNGIGIQSPSIVFSGTKLSTYSDDQIAMNDTDYSLTGKVSGNIIKNKNTIISGNAKNNYIGYDNTDIKMFNYNDNTYITNTIIGNDNSKIYVNGQSKNIIIGNGNIYVTINDAERTTIGHNNSNITIQKNSKNNKIYNDCNNISIGNGITYNLNNIIFSKCTKSSIIGSNNTIYQNNSNVQCISTYMVTVGQETGNILPTLTYHNNYGMYLNQKIQSYKQKIGNFLDVKSVIMINKENPNIKKEYQKDNAFNTKINGWELPNSIDGSKFNLQLKLSKYIDVSYYFYDISSGMIVDSFDDESITFNVKSTVESIYDNWFEYDKKRKLQKNFKLITYSGDRNKPIYIDSSGCKDINNSNFVYIGDSSKNILSQGSFYLKDPLAINTSLYLDTSLNSTLNFTLSGFMVSEINSYKLLGYYDLDNGSTRSINGTISNYYQPTLYLDIDTSAYKSQSVSPTFKIKDANNYLVSLKYNYGKNIDGSCYKYRTQDSNIKNGLIMYFYDKGGNIIDQIKIYIGQVEDNIGIIIRYLDWKPGQSPLYKKKIAKPTEFKGITTINQKDYIYWSISPTLNYYVLLTNELKDKLEQGINIDSSLLQDDVSVFYGSPSRMYNLNINNDGFILFTRELKK